MADRGGGNARADVPVGNDMRIDVFSDVVCPWCWLGKTRLEAALERLDFGDEVELHWRAFQLDPTATSEPQDLRTALEAKYGPGSFDSMTERLTTLGSQVGLDYRFDLAQRVTSLPALRLVAWVEGELGRAAAHALHDRLFEAYFSDGANITDPDLLVGLATEVGADRAAARTAVEAEAGADTVAADLALARQSGISAVPSFVVDERHLIQGAQDVDTLVAMLTQVHAPA